MSDKPDLCLMMIALHVLSADTLIKTSLSGFKFETCFLDDDDDDDVIACLLVVVVDNGINTSPVTNTVCTPDTLEISCIPEFKRSLS